MSFPYTPASVRINETICIRFFTCTSIMYIYTSIYYQYIQKLPNLQSSVSSVGCDEHPVECSKHILTLNKTFTINL